jgi:hypothetical protein
MDDKKWAEISAKWAGKELEFKSSKKPFDFENSLKKGQASEHDFFMKYQQHLTRTDGRRGDFLINKNDEILELKADYHDPETTPNMFMELYSYKEEPGGVFQAQANGVKYYAYWFPTGDLLYLFNVNQLVKRMKKLMPTMKKCFIKNKHHTTTGYIVERSLLEDLCLDPDEVILNGE